MTEPIQLVDLDDLVGRLEIAERAGVKVATVDTWRRRYTHFPEPFGVISGTPLWLWPAVEAWIAATPRLAGRPPSDWSPARRTPLPDRLRHVIRKTDSDGNGDNGAPPQTHTA